MKTELVEGTTEETNTNNKQNNENTQIPMGQETDDKSINLAKDGTSTTTTSTIQSSQTGENIIDTMMTTNINSSVVMPGRAYEVIAAIGTGIIHIVLEIPFLIWIPALFTCWTVYLSYRVYSGGDKSQRLLLMKYWGLYWNTKLFLKVFGYSSILAVFGIGIMVIWSYFCGFDQCYYPLNWHILFLFAVYPIYGIVQQFLIQNMIASNLQSYKLNNVLIVLITAAAFGMVHYGESELYFKLMILTSGFGLVFTPLYLKYKCLYPLGLYHGWLGALAYFILLNQDPAEMILGD